MILAKGKRTNPIKYPFEVAISFSLILSANISPFCHPNNVLEPSWAVLRASWRPLGRSWARLGASWAVLERLGGVLRRLRAVLGRLGRVLERSKRQKRGRGAAYAAMLAGNAALLWASGSLSFKDEQREQEQEENLFRPLQTRFMQER